MKVRSLAVLIAFSLTAKAQTFNFNHQNLWQAIPEKHTLNKDFASASAVGILDDRSIEYRMEDKEVALYSTYHRIYRINDDKGIEMFNKVYLPYSASAVITDVKARTVLGNGKVINISADKIKEIQEEGSTYKLFAMEGVEKNAEIEYQYTVKRPVSFFGSEVFQSSTTPCQVTTFTLSYPKHLKFDARGFNGFAVSADSLINDKRMIVGYDNNVPEIEDEKYAVREPYLKRVDYKLSYNLSGNEDVRLYTWKEFAKRAYSIYTFSTPKDDKPVAELFNSTKAGNAATLEAKILAIEDYLKSTISVDKDLIGDDAGTIEKIISRKSTDNQGIIRLFALLFEKAAINYQIVFAGRRDQISINEEIENWNRVDETVFYFPETRKFLSPSSIELRYPFIPCYWAGTRGLFLKGTTIGSFKSAIGSFKLIDMLPADSHAHDMEAEVSLNGELDTVYIKSSQVLKGYGAAGFRPVYTFLAKDKQDEATRDLIKSVANSTNISNIKIENTQLNDLAANKPLIIAADISTTEMTERAGNKILLKIGEIIGPQEQMYQEKPRQLPVELPYPHTLKRKIVLHVPADYMVKNLNDLNMNIEYRENNEVTMGFVSSYVQSGKTVTINILESYNRLKYPLSQFNEFKQVINAAADFNKIVLVLEKN